MVDVLLVKPPLSAEMLYGALSGVGAYDAPLGIAYLAASLREKDISVELLDGSLAGISFDKLAEFIIDKNPKYLGFSAVTLEIDSAAKLALQVKEKVPGIKTILGGVHLTATPSETMEKFPQFDIGVLGEGEATLVELIRALEEKTDYRAVQGIVFRDEDRVVISPPRMSNKDLDALPLPAWDLLPGFPERYSSAAYATHTSHSCSILTSRGCGHRCTFCFQGSMGRLLRFHKAEYVLDLIKHLYHKYGIRDFRILDDQFLANKKRTVEICNLLIDENLGITFSCLARINTINPEILRLLKRAGCRQISFGIESGSQRILDLIKKGIKLEEVEQAVKWTKQAGIKTLGYFMMGFPTETEQTLQETIDFACQLLLDDISFFFLTPFPGTEIHRDVQCYGLFNENWSTMSLFTDPSFIPEGLTKEMLIACRKKVFLRFYMKPRIIWAYLKRLNSPARIKGFFEGLLAMGKLVFSGGRSKAS